MTSTGTRLARSAAVAFVLPTCSTAAWCHMQEGLLGHVRGLEARETAIEAYMFGYPLVTMEITR